MIVPDMYSTLKGHRKTAILDLYQCAVQSAQPEEHRFPTGDRLAGLVRCDSARQSIMNGLLRVSTEESIDLIQYRRHFIRSERIRLLIHQADDTIVGLLLQTAQQRMGPSEAIGRRQHAVERRHRRVHLILSADQQQRFAGSQTADQGGETQRGLPGPAKVTAA